MSLNTAAKRKRRSDEKAFLTNVIDSVKLKSCLFDRDDKDFTDDDMSDAAWKAVADSCIDNDTQELSEEDKITKVQKAWDSCKKSFSRERSRREQQPSSSKGGWSLFEHMAFMDRHIKRTPRSSNSASKSTTKRRRVDHDSQKENQNTQNLSQEHSNHSVSGLDVDGSFPDDETQQEARDLARREKEVRDMQARIERERALQIKKEELEAQQEESRLSEERRKQEREARKQQLAKQSQREASEKKLIKSTADYIVGVLDSMMDENDRIDLARQIMTVIYTP